VTVQLILWDFPTAGVGIPATDKPPASVGKATIPGRQGYVEVIDGDNSNAYAWLAIGRFEPPVLTVPSMSPNAMGARQHAAAELARDLSLSNLETPLARLLASDRAEVEPRAAAARALLRLGSRRNMPSVTALLRDATV